MSNPTIVPIREGVTCVVYTSKPPVISASEYTFVPGTIGYVISTHTDGTKAVTVIGGAQKPVDIYGKRRVDYVPTNIDPSNPVFFVNDVKTPIDDCTWIENPNAFVIVSNGRVRIDRATNGYYCINNEALFCLKYIPMGLPVAIETDESGQRSLTVPKGVRTIYHDGYTEVLGNMLKQDPSDPNKLLIDEAARIRENFYFEMQDESFVDVEMPNLVIPTITFPTTFAGVVNLLSGFSAVASQMPPIDKSMAFVDILVTRAGQQSQTVRIPLKWLSDEQLRIHELYLEAKHSAQETSIDFSHPSFSLSAIDGRPVGIIDFTKWCTRLKCVFQSGAVGEISVYRDLIAYDTITTSAIRFKASSEIGPLSSQDIYMINGRVYDRGVEEEAYSTSFDGQTLTIRPRKGMTQYAVFDGNRTWSSTSTKQEIVFDPTYRMVLTVGQKTEVDLNIFGDYSEMDSFTYYAGTKGASTFKDLPRGIYKVKPTEDIPSGTIIETMAFTATLVSDPKQTFSFSVTFVYEEFPRTSFLIQGSPDFSTPYIRRASFSGSFTGNPADAFWMYGQFIAKAGEMIHAYQDEVTDDSDSSNIYPIVRFDGRGVAMVVETVGSLPIKTEVITEDMTIPAGPGDKYVRLNPCSNVSYAGSSYIVPKNTGVCFFRLGDTIYLIRSARNVLPGGSASGSPTAADTRPSASGSNPPSRNGSFSRVLSGFTAFSSGTTRPMTPMTAQTLRQLPASRPIPSQLSAVSAFTAAPSVIPETSPATRIVSRSTPTVAAVGGPSTAYAPIARSSESQPRPTGASSEQFSSASSFSATPESMTISRAAQETSAFSSVGVMSSAGTASVTVTYTAGIIHGVPRARVVPATRKPRPKGVCHLRA